MAKKFHLSAGQKSLESYNCNVSNVNIGAQVAVFTVSSKSPRYSVTELFWGVANFFMMIILIKLNLVQVPGLRVYSSGTIWF